MTHPYRIALLSSLLMAFALVSAAEERKASFELFLGNAFLNLDTDSDAIDDILDNQPVYGLRAGRRVGGRWGAELAISRFHSDASLATDLGPGNEALDLSLDATFLDLSATYYIPTRRGDWILFGGPGWVFAEIEATLRGSGFSESDDDDVFSAHAGVAYKASLGERFYLRPDVRARWIEDTESAPDFEASLALGLRF